jgi:predicted nucleic acid-binding Zn ribbon protein
MNDKRFARVGELLPAVLKSFGLEHKFRDQEVLALWPEVVGEQIAARTKAVRIEKGVLFVHVNHGAWMQELHFKEKELVKELRDRAPRSTVRRIRFGTFKDAVATDKSAGRSVDPLPEERAE